MNSEYTTIDDVRKLFTEDMNDLYLLAFLLTGNRGNAERCFVAGLADCVDGNPVFKKMGSFLGSAHHSPQRDLDNSASY